MDAVLLGTVSTLAGVIVAGGIAIVRDALGEKRQARRDAERRAHEISEARFDVRRDAYVTFGAACHRAINAGIEFAEQHGVMPGDQGYEPPIKYLVDAQNLILIIGPQEAVEAAQKATAAIDGWTFAYKKRSYEDVEAAVEEFAKVTRRLLKFDVT
jgi:hypothetical protein